MQQQGPWALWLCPAKPRIPNTPSFFDPGSLVWVGSVLTLGSGSSEEPSTNASRDQILAGLYRADRGPLFHTSLLEISWTLLGPGRSVGRQMSYGQYSGW